MDALWPVGDLKAHGGILGLDVFLGRVTRVSFMTCDMTGSPVEGEVHIGTYSSIHLRREKSAQCIRALVSTLLTWGLAW